MLSYGLHRLAINQDRNRSVEDGVDNGHPADPPMHPCQGDAQANHTPIPSTTERN